MATIDWYDGIVLAVVSTNWMEGQYLGSLLAFDLELKKRVVALLPLDEGDVSEIKSLLEGDWELLLSFLKELWHKASGKVTLLLCTDSDEHVVSGITMDASEVRPEAISDIEEAVSASRVKWFDALASWSREG